MWYVLRMVHTYIRHSDLGVQLYTQDFLKGGGR